MKIICSTVFPKHSKLKLLVDTLLQITLTNYIVLDEIDKTSHFEINNTELCDYVSKYLQNYYLEY